MSNALREHWQRGSKIDRPPAPRSAITPDTKRPARNPITTRRWCESHRTPAFGRCGELPASTSAVVQA